MPIEPPSATTTTTIGISATSPTFTLAFGKKRAGTSTVPSSGRKGRKKGKEALAAGDSGLHLQEAPQGQGAKQPTGANGDSDHLDNTDCTSESSGSSSSGSGGVGGGGGGEKNHGHNHRHPPDTHPALSMSSSSSGAGPSSAPTHTGSGADKRQGPQHSGREDKLLSTKNQQRYETNPLRCLSAFSPIGLLDHGNHPNQD